MRVSYTVIAIIIALVLLALALSFGTDIIPHLASVIGNISSSTGAT